MTSESTHYQTIGVHERASAEDIKKAFRRLVLEHHPDRHQGDPSSEATFKRINAAYEVIGDDTRRARYDKDLLVSRMKRAAAHARAATPPGHAQSPPWRPPPPTPPPPTPSSAATSSGLGGWGLFFMGLGAIAAMAAARGSETWDPSAGRYRGRDGRFTSG